MTDGGSGLAAGAALAPEYTHARWTLVIDRVIAGAVEALGSAILVVEVCLLATDVFCRYVLDNALVWGDELATVLFLWLTMLGAVGAYCRNEHMRSTALLRRMRPGGIEICGILVTLLIAVFALQLLAAAIWPTVIPDYTGLRDLIGLIVSGDFFASGYLGQEATDILPAMQIPRIVVVAGIVVGLVLILIVSVDRLIRSRPTLVLASFAGLLAFGAAIYLGRDLLAGLGNLNLVLFFVVLVAAEIAIGVPIAFAFGIATMSYLAVMTDVPLSVVASQMDQGMSNPVLLAIPLFVLLGLLIEVTGIARRLIDAISAFIGHLPGGLNIVLVAAMFLVSGISGSKLADMAAVTPVLFPEMERRGYQRSEMIALLSTSGAMAELIPPSLVLIIIGTVCNLSIQQLFIGGLLPAAVAAGALIAVAVLRSRRFGYTVVPRASGATRIRALVIAAPGLLLPLVIRYFVVGGIATATEVSTIGLIYSLATGLLIYREFDWRRCYPMLAETVRLTGSIMLIISMATGMGWALTQSGFAAELSDALLRAPGGRFVFIALSIVLFVVLGSVLEGIPAIVLFGPLLFPIVKQFGINEIHYAVIAILAMSIGLFSPPLGVGYYGACAVGKCDPDTAALAVLPYIVALLASVVIIAAFPWISTGFL
ncbi:TRAP transporter large permease subunit [Acidisphaera sp. S103]|uniref:TRAP transporter large permease n=1 Tax=Acidisphaera sp. S103 TaxID=1747223 RepID=UPI00131CFCAB|nr:TRAP transporter large permease subunit [Acidisphaera sp. S103]